MSPSSPDGGSPVVDGATLLFVNGTLMRGLALHANLAGAEFLEETTTAPAYRLYSIGDRHPGMHRVDGEGVSVAGELYRVPPATLGRVVRGEPPGLYVDEVELMDGRRVPGVLFDPALLTSADRDISRLGGWRAYVASRSPEMTRSPERG